MSDTADTTTETATTDAPQGTEGDESTETPSVEELQRQLDEWKGHARKHEANAKANKSAAEELDRIKAANMTEAEKTAKALRDAEARATKAEAEAARLRVATKHGLTEADAELLTTVSDEDAMNKLAERLAAAATTPAPTPAVQPNPGQGNRTSSNGATTPAELFAAQLDELFS